MSLNNTNTVKKNSGFTIVELLIVIVVIGILAAITIVAFNGIQNRANATAAEALAVDMIKKAEAYNAVEGQYPTAAVLKAGTAVPPEAKLETKLSNAIQTAAATAPDKSNGKTTISYALCGAGAGVKIGWYDFTKSTATVEIKNAGNTTGTCS